MTSSELTPREINILNMRKLGLTSKEIAQKLEIGEQTVKSHTSSLSKKLHAKNTTHAVYLAMKEGVIE